MFEDRFWYAVNVAKNSFSAGEQEFYSEKGFANERSAAKGVGCPQGKRNG